MAEAAALKTALARTQEQLKSAETDLHAKLERAQERLKSAESDLQRERASPAKRELVAQSSGVSADELATSEARVQQLQRQLGSAQGKLQSAEEQLSEARAEGRHLSSQLQAERVQCAALKEEVQGLRAERHTAAAAAASRSSRDVSPATATVPAAAPSPPYQLDRQMSLDSRLNRLSADADALSIVPQTPAPHGVLTRQGSVAGAAAERLTRSAAKLEAEMHALSGLLGEEETALSAEQAAVDQSRKALEMQNRALRTVLQNVKPFAKAHGEYVHRETAAALRERLATVRSLLREADEEGESGDSSSIKPKPKAAALSSSRRDEEEQAATVDEYLKRGKWGASARMR